ALEGDTAIEAGLDLFDVVLEAAQRVDMAGPVHHVVAQQANLRVAAHHAVGDHAAGDIADARHAEHIADLDHADDLFALFGRQHAGRRVSYIVDVVVDDVVVAQVDAVAFGQFLGALFGADVKADDDGVRVDGQVDVAFGDAAHRSVHHLDADFVGGQLEQRLQQGFL